MNLPYPQKEDQRILRLRKRLRTSHPVRQAAERLLQGKETIEDIQPLLDMLAKPLAWRWKERLLAAWVLGHARLDAQQKSAAAATLAAVLSGKPVDRGRDWLMPFGRAVCLYVPLVIAVTVYIWAARPQGEWVDKLIDIALPGFFFVFMLVYPFSAALDDSHTDKVRATATASLGTLCQPECVGILAAAIMDGSARVKRAASGALPSILSTLSTSHYRQLPPGTIPQLCRVLRHRNAELVLKVLDALGKVGDGSAISAVEPLARIRRTSRIQEEAERILPILKERQQQEIAQATLLRASDVGADGLLRASEQGTEEGSDQLLRISQGQEQP